MIRYNPITGEQGYCIAVARASVGIYLVLKQRALSANSKVIVPANLCYAGIYPIVYAGATPVFCDVDERSGNVTFESFLSACSEDTVAAIIPHMYGNPVEEMVKICGYCKEKNILIIEDCASAMGAKAFDYSVGCMGDYVVYSTGYSKTLDLGLGGFLYSKENDLSVIESEERKLPDFTEENEKNMTFFSKLYRTIRNQGTDSRIEKMIYQGLAECCKSDFLHRIDDEKKEWLFSELKNLDRVISERRSALEKYRAKVKRSDRFEYKYSEGAVPWRYNLLIESSDLRYKIIQECLEASLPVSDWYPCVTKLFGEARVFQGADRHEKMIINFPLLVDDCVIEKICDILNNNL